MSTRMIGGILGIVLVIFSDVANGHGGGHFADHTGEAVDSSMKYDRRALVGAGPPVIAGPPVGAVAGAGAAAVAAGPGGVIDISKLPGAKPDGTSDTTQALLQAWNTACRATGASTILIPAGIWFHTMLDFRGPCTSSAITFNLMGTLRAKNDAASYPNNMHINFWRVPVTLTGTGTIDGNGQVLQAERQKNEKNLPDSLAFSQCANAGINGVKFINAKGFNLKVIECDNFKADRLDIHVPGETLNTDGIHIARCKGASITNTAIGVGDDCISIGDAMADFTIRNIQCGPGHGISIGSLGKFPDEKDVVNVEVSNVTFTGTQNGVRIKTFHNSPVLNVRNITFSDITIKDVWNPILIDQHYNSGNGLATSGVSKVKITGVTYRNIKGNSMTNKAITLNCSSAAPCEGITLQNIQFTYTGNESLDKSLTSFCENAKAVFTATTPPACKM